MKPIYRILLFVLLFIWVAGNFSGYLVKFSDFFLLPETLLKKSYALVCHQQSYKLICVDNACTQLCARCTGIYLGGLLTSIITLFVSKIGNINLKFLLVSVVLIIADVIFYNVGIYAYNHYIASATGLFLGSVAFLYIRSGFEKLLSELK